MTTPRQARISSATGGPIIRKSAALIEETRLVHESRDAATQWIVDNMANKEDVEAIEAGIAALTQLVTEGFTTLGVHISNGDHRLRPTI